MIRREYSGFRALMMVLCTPPSARRFRHLFLRSRSEALTRMVLGMTPNTGTISAFPLWHNGFIRRRMARRTKGNYRPGRIGNSTLSQFISKPKRRLLDPRRKSA